MFQIDLLEHFKISFKCPKCRGARMKKVEHSIGGFEKVRTGFLGLGTKEVYVPAYVVYWTCPKCNYEVTDKLIEVMLEKANKKLKVRVV